jgi:hypothetical protein
MTTTYYILLITLEPNDPDHPIYISFNGSEYEPCPNGPFTLSANQATTNTLIMASDYIEEIEVPLH